MNNILVPIVDGIDALLRDDLIDEKLLVDVLGIETEICQQCRNVWRMPQRHRLGRSKIDIRDSDKISHRYNL
jgi:hypothetical protein